MAFSFDLDPRSLLARPDLAEQALEGLIPAGRYRPTQPKRCRIGFAPITAETGEAIGEILFGEAFDLLDEVDGRGWGRARRDGTVGYVDLDLLESLTELPTARVATTEAPFPLNALVTMADGVAPEDLADFDTFDMDLATVAERLLGAPYRAGGRSRAGLDCAGLVQQALLACGRPAPRWSDLQARLGRETASVRRGDLIIWVGFHTAIASDTDNLIHACPDNRCILVESIAQVDARWRLAGAPNPVFRRL
ncbi:MAG: C40 family peptidase [Caulobacterales bacterium]|nr:C40 family peptidase [Caulobacterales bacterium]